MCFLLNRKKILLHCRIRHILRINFSFPCNLCLPLGFILLYILYVVTTWAASHVHLKKSNSQVYQRCANYLKGLKRYAICKRREPTSGSANEGDEASSRKDVCRLQSLWMRFCGLIKSRRTVSDTIFEDDVELGSKKSSALRDSSVSGRNETAYFENDGKSNRIY